MKTPISYYGGKQKLMNEIIPLIPEHILYAEPFCGGAAIFFGKEPSKVEVLNDTNSELVNFYRVAQNHFVDLNQMVRVTLHSRRLHKDAQVVYEHPHLFSEIKRAWAVWVLSTQSFAAMLDGSFGYDKQKDTTTKKINNKRDSFSEDISVRLQHATIECADALYVIKSRDTDGSFFYCDPPYFNSDCGHYDGYTKEDFELLLKTLSEVKGKFLLSSYPSDLLTRYTRANGWHFKLFEQGVSINSKGGYIKKKWEVLTANYPI
ncbi:MAG: DNA adenine methylase [Taibaiella sp.]